MALDAELTYFDGFVSIFLYPGRPKASIGSAPDDRFWPFGFYYDDEKFARGEREFLGLDVLDISLITDEWLAELKKIELPRVDVHEAGLFNVTISDVLRWARQTYPSRYSNATA